MDGFGNINWWGFSPSIDLIENVETNQISDELNILIVNSGDQRHILNTITSLPKYAKIKKVNFYIYEKMLEIYARDFLLLSLVFEHPTRRGIQEKTELFLEIYGNLLIREFTSSYIQTKSNDFIKYITDWEILQKTNLKIFDFNSLKFNERDFLEGIFKFWRLKLTPEQFPVGKCWEYRLRTYFGVRYDSRSNGYDWDFAMKLSDRPNTAIINNRIYAKWRETGIAFELRDSTYDTANKTLASGMIFDDPRGDKTSRRGFFGDIIIGPFLSYGIESKNKDFFKKQNEIYRFTSLDIARDNVSNYMSAVLEQNGFDLKNTHKNLTDKVNGLKIQEIIEEDEENGEIETNLETKATDEDEYITINNIKISFLPLSVFQDFIQKTKYDSFFDVVYFSNSGSVHFNKSIKKILKPNAIVIFETVKYMIELSNEQIKTFSDRLKQIAQENNFKDLNKYDDYLKEEKKVGENNSNKVKLESLNHLIFKNIC